MVYPRVCGGTAMPLVATYLVAGLSPRVRGNRRTFQDFVRQGGSIPACAGEPGKQVLYALIGHVIGLSPRVRGNLCHVVRGDNHLQ